MFVSSQLVSIDTRHIPCLHHHGSLHCHCHMIWIYQIDYSHKLYGRAGRGLPVWVIYVCFPLSFKPAILTFYYKDIPSVTSKSSVWDSGRSHLISAGVHPASSYPSSVSAWGVNNTNGQNIYWQQMSFPHLEWGVYISGAQPSVWGHIRVCSVIPPSVPISIYTTLCS